MSNKDLPIKQKHLKKEYIEDNRLTVMKLSQLGCTDKEIASIVGTSETSVKTHFRADLDEGRGHLRSSLRKAQIEAAIKEKNPTMLIWLGKCYLGQKEPKHNVEHSGGITVEKIVYSVTEDKTKNE